MSKTDDTQLLDLYRQIDNLIKISNNTPQYKPTRQTIRDCNDSIFATKNTELSHDYQYTVLNQSGEFNGDPSHGMLNTQVDVKTERRKDRVL